MSIELGRLYARRAEAYGDLLAQIATGKGPRGLAQVFAIRPVGAAIEKLERRRQRLVDGAADGLQAVMTAIGHATAGSSGIPEMVDATSR
jgi:hypothetical protein